MNKRRTVGSYEAIQFANWILSNKEVSVRDKPSSFYFKGKRIKSECLYEKYREYVCLKAIEADFKENAIKYRDHRGSLTESLETTIEVINIGHLKYHLNLIWNPIGRHVSEIKFEYLGFDERTGWDTYYVMQRLDGDTDFTVAGMSDGVLE